MLRGGYAPAVVPMTTPQGPIEALAFVSNPSHPSYVGELPFAETASLIASGTGILGTNREYLVQLATQLDALGIEDPYVAQLHAQMDAGRDRLTLLGARRNQSVAIHLRVGGVGRRVDRDRDRLIE